MPTEILHHEGRFVLWTSVCDAPCSPVLDLEGVRDYLRHEELVNDRDVEQMLHPKWGDLARTDYMRDVYETRAKIERRIVRAVRNGASGLRWYDEKHDGEYWAAKKRTFTVAEIIAELEAQEEDGK